MKWYTRLHLTFFHSNEEHTCWWANTSTAHWEYWAQIAGGNVDFFTVENQSRMATTPCRTLWPISDKSKWVDFNGVFSQHLRLMTVGAATPVNMVRAPLSWSSQIVCLPLHDQRTMEVTQLAAAVSFCSPGFLLKKEGWWGKLLFSRRTDEDKCLFLRQAVQNHHPSYALITWH